MTKIPAQDIEAVSLLEDRFRRVVEETPKSNDDRFKVAQDIIQIIVTQADQMINTSADNLGSALNVIHGALNRAADLLENSSIAACPKYVSEVREVATSYDPSI